MPPYGVSNPSPDANGAERDEAAEEYGLVIEDCDQTMISLSMDAPSTSQAYSPGRSVFAPRPDATLGPTPSGHKSRR